MRRKLLRLLESADRLQILLAFHEENPSLVQTVHLV
jgi:hypothetical protein